MLAEPAIRVFEQTESFTAHSSHVYSIEMSPIDDMVALSSGTDDVPGWVKGDGGRVRSK